MRGALRINESQRHRIWKSRCSSQLLGLEANQTSDLATRMSSLGLQQATSNSLQQQKQADAQNPQYGASAHAEEPLTAPTPTRANVPPPSGMWTPEVGIRFGGVPTSSGNARPSNGPPQDGRWDPTQGLKFG
jgi:programmed cell death 6-interacting protein